MAANPYDPVTTTDSTHLTDDDWGVSLPPPRYNRFSETSRFKSVCNTLRHHSTIVMISVAAIFLVVLIIIIIAVAANNDSGKHPTGNEAKREEPEQGLVFYPVPEDKSIVISFNPSKFQNMAPQPLKSSLDAVIDSYDILKQLNEELYTDCNITYRPSNKICRIARTMFGDDCTTRNSYGYSGNQPCVFIQLNLPGGVTIKPITEDSALWEKVKTVVMDKKDPSFVPLTCKGTDPEDVEFLEKPGFGPKGEWIMYFPSQGLQSYIYRERNLNLPFLKPGVMVQFTKLSSKHLVHVTCTVWGQLYDHMNKMIDHQLLSTQFALYANDS